MVGGWRTRKEEFSHGTTLSCHAHCGRALRIEGLDPGRDQDHRQAVPVRAGLLLLCDRGPEGPGWTVARVAEALGVSARTIEHLKRRFVEQGLEFALERKRRVRPPRKVIFDGAFEARLVALACSQAPPGRKRWTLRLLAEKVVELGWVERVSVMTVQRTLKKTNCSLIGRSIGGSRPGAAPHS